MSNIKLSIIVCVYNGEKDIGRCLDSLVNQKASPDLFEVIVVNNNSTDRTQEIADSYYGKIKNYKVVTEYAIGLSNARNRGYKESIANYVGYIDDDAKARPDYIEKAIRIIEEIQPDIFGGPIYPFYVSEKPEWFKDQYEIRLAQKETGFMNRGTLSGSNIIFKKELLRLYNGFNPALGMEGDNLGYGEETKLVERAFKEKRKIYYDVDLIVEHIVPPFKMNILYFIVKAFKGSYQMVSTNQQESIIYLDEISMKFKNLFNDIESNFKNKYSEEKIENFLIENNRFDSFSLLGILSALIEKKEFNKIKKSRKNFLTPIKSLIKKILFKKRQ
ncbi:MAG TPA: glycosyltransferase family 2 protein [Spirochaetota bacterium]|nr:glycosyltransferase family 2 protein [Spirochaetota bacterium]